jgi:hypothetical protein
MAPNPARTAEIPPKARVFSAPEPWLAAPLVTAAEAEGRTPPLAPAGEEEVMEDLMEVEEAEAEALEDVRDDRFSDVELRPRFKGYVVSVRGERHTLRTR